MRDIPERIAIELRWPEVCDIVSVEIEEILGFHVQCKTNVIENSFWDVTFPTYRLPKQLAGTHGRDGAHLFRYKGHEA